MKKWMAAVLIAVGLAAGARADNGWGIYGAYWTPGDWDGAGGVGAKISFEIVPNALLDLRGTWLEDLETDDGGATLELEAIPWEAGLTIRSGWEPVDVYVCGGLGYYQMEGDIALPGGGRQDADFSEEIGYYGGVGLEVTVIEEAADLGATRITLFAEALYRGVSVDDVSVDGIGTFDGDVGGFAFNAGFMIRW